MAIWLKRSKWLCCNACLLRCVSGKSSNRSQGCDVISSASWFAAQTSTVRTAQRSPITLLDLSRIPWEWFRRKVTSCEGAAHSRDAHSKLSIQGNSILEGMSNLKVPLVVQDITFHSNAEPRAAPKILWKDYEGIVSIELKSSQPLHVPSRRSTTESCVQSAFSFLVGRGSLRLDICE